MSRVTIEINQASGLRDSFQIRSASRPRDILQIKTGRDKTGREQEVTCEEGLPMSPSFGKSFQAMIDCYL